MKQEAIQPIQWRNGALFLLDQRKLPREEVYVECRTAEAVADAIRDMVVRGAPAIGIAAAYGYARRIFRAAATMRGRRKWIG